MEPRYNLAILAGNFRQFTLWRKDNEEMLLISNTRPVYLATPKVLRGMRGMNFLRVGTYWMHPDFDEIEKEVRMLKMIEGHRGV